MALFRRKSDDDERDPEAVARWDALQNMLDAESEPDEAAQSTPAETPPPWQQQESWRHHENEPGPGTWPGAVPPAPSVPQAPPVPPVPPAAPGMVNGHSTPEDAPEVRPEPPAPPAPSPDPPASWDSWDAVISSTTYEDARSAEADSAQQHVESPIVEQPDTEPVEEPEPSPEPSNESTVDSSGLPDAGGSLISGGAPWDSARIVLPARIPEPRAGSETPAEPEPKSPAEPESRERTEPSEPVPTWSAAPIADPGSLSWVEPDTALNPSRPARPDPRLSARSPLPQTFDLPAHVRQNDAQQKAEQEAEETADSRHDEAQDPMPAPPMAQPAPPQYGPPQQFAPPPPQYGPPQQFAPPQPYGPPAPPNQPVQDQPAQNYPAPNYPAQNPPPPNPPPPMPPQQWQPQQWQPQPGPPPGPQAPQPTQPAPQWQQQAPPPQPPAPEQPGPQPNQPSVAAEPPQPPETPPFVWTDDFESGPPTGQNPPDSGQRPAQNAQAAPGGFGPPQPGQMQPVHPGQLGQPVHPGQPQSPPGPPGSQPGPGPYVRRPGSPSVDDLTASALVERRSTPQVGWRKAVYRISAHAVNPGISRGEQHRRELIGQATVPVHGCYRIAVISLKGGVGKTTTTVCLGATLASLRGDRVIAVDANPDRGTLSGKIPLQTTATVRNLLNDVGRIERYSDVRRYTSQSPDRLEVLASESDPSVSLAFSEADYRKVAGVLERYYNVVLTDCGTGLLHSAMAGVLAMANQLVVVSSGSVDGARSASATIDWLEAHGYSRLVAGSVAVINSVRPKSGGVNLDALEEHFASRCRAVTRIPYDTHLELGAEVDLAELAPPTRDALLELAADVAAGFPRPDGPPAPPMQPYEGPR